MTSFEHEPQSVQLFTSEEYIKKYNWDNTAREYTFRRVAVSSDLITGFEDTIIPKEVVAGMLSRTINGMINHGASALGLDLDSMAGRVHASGHLTAAMDIGATILNDFAPRTDEKTWHDWIKDEFPSAVAALHGDNSVVTKFTKEEMEAPYST